MSEVLLINIDASIELMQKLKKNTLIFFNISVFGFLPDLPL